MDDNNKIETITLYNNPDSDIFPEKDLPENARLLRGFEWRGEERIKSKDDIYPADEVELHNAIVLRSKEKYEEEKVKRQIEGYKLNDHENGDDFYEDFFIKYNNYIVEDINKIKLLVRNFKFKFPIDNDTFEVYKKINPKYKKEIKINKMLWNWKTMTGKKYDGGHFNGNEEANEIEIPEKEILTFEEIFKLYDNRVIVDRNGAEIFVKSRKFMFPVDANALNNLKRKYPTCRKIVRINQVVWDWKTMLGKEYDGGSFTGKEE